MQEEFKRRRDNAEGKASSVDMLAARMESKQTMSKDFIKRIILLFDRESTGVIDIRQMIAIMTLQLKELLIEDKIEIVSQLADADGSGNISCEEFYNVLHDVAVSPELDKKLYRAIKRVHKETQDLVNGMAKDSVSAKESSFRPDSAMKEIVEEEEEEEDESDAEEEEELNSKDITKYFSRDKEFCQILNACIKSSLRKED